MKTHFQRPDRLTAPLDVIIPVFNSARYRSRWKHYQDFVSMAERAGETVRLWTVEVAFGDREFVLPRHARTLRLRTSHELWHKERSQNLLLQHVLSTGVDVEYVAFIDADISFVRHDWADETRHALQHYDVVQMWSEAYDMDAQHEVMQRHRSFASCYGELGVEEIPADGNYYAKQGSGRTYWHPGYAWAWRRSALDSVGGLIDHAILGSADFHMAYALVGEVERTLNARLHATYTDAMRRWQERAERTIRRNVGCVHGAIMHHFHGPKAARRYKSRWKILEQTQFDHMRDLVTDAQGLYALHHDGSPRHHQLRDLTRRYFHERDEDASR